MTKGAAACLTDGGAAESGGSAFAEHAAIIRAWNTRTEGRDSSLTDWIGGRSGETICVTRIEGERMRTNERAAAGGGETEHARLSLLELVTHVLQRTTIDSVFSRSCRTSDIKVQLLFR